MNRLRSNIAAIILFVEDLPQAKQFYLDDLADPAGHIWEIAH